MLGDHSRGATGAIVRRWLAQQPWTLILIVLIVGLAAGGGTALVSWKLNAPVNHLMRDGVAVLGGRWWIGFMSQLGIVVWSAAAGVCLLSALAIRGRGARGGPGFGLFFSAGVLSLLLAIDDAIMIHEDMLPPLGVPEEATMGLYMLLLAAILLRYARVLLAHSAVLLAVALGAFAASVVVDLNLLFSLAWDRHILLENSLKFLGIVAWAAYFTRLGAEALGTAAQVESAAPAAFSRFNARDSSATHEIEH